MEPLQEQELLTLILEHVGDGGRTATVAEGVTVAVVGETTPPVVAASRSLPEGKAWAS
ncbi:hypothetical protein [Streptomyces canarius]